MDTKVADVAMWRITGLGDLTKYLEVVSGLPDLKKITIGTVATEPDL